MTAAAIPAGIVPPRPAWRSLLWIAAPTLLWTLLIYWRPTISDSGVPTAAARLTTHGLIALGLWLGLESTELTPGQRRTTWLAVMIPYTLWFAVAWSAAINGVFRTGPAAAGDLPASRANGRRAEFSTRVSFDSEASSPHERSEPPDQARSWPRISLRPSGLLAWNLNHRARTDLNTVWT